MVGLGRTRTYTIRVRVTEQERQMLKDLAAQEGESLSGLLRRLIRQASKIKEEAL